MKVSSSPEVSIGVLVELAAGALSSPDELLAAVAASGAGAATDAALG